MSRASRTASGRWPVRVVGFMEQPSVIWASQVSPSSVDKMHNTSGEIACCSCSRVDSSASRRSRAVGIVRATWLRMWSRSLVSARVSTRPARAARRRSASSSRARANPARRTAASVPRTTPSAGWVVHSGLELLSSAVAQVEASPARKHSTPCRVPQPNAATVAAASRQKAYGLTRPSLNPMAMPRMSPSVIGLMRSMRRADARCSGSIDRQVVKNNASVVLTTMARSPSADRPAPNNMPKSTAVHLSEAIVGETVALTAGGKSKRRVESSAPPWRRTCSAPAASSRETGGSARGAARRSRAGSDRRFASLACSAVMAAWFQWVRPARNSAR